MKKQIRNRLTALLLAASLIALCLLTACGNQGQPSESPSPSGSAPVETGSTTGEAITITDMAGRTVTFPKNPEKELEQKLGTPVICVNYDLKEIPEVTRLLGQWLGVEERGSELADYLQGELDKVSESIAKVPAEEVVSYYYAEDASGLMTESADSFHAAVFSFCGLNCVTDVTCPLLWAKNRYRWNR